MAKAIPVELQQTEEGWQLLRGGEPYLIQGVGGTHSLEVAAAAGANSVRTWGADDAGRILDEAHSLGLTVTVGIWLGHERHGFDYNDKAQVKEQLERARQIVLRYKDHPALLLWGIGNEMEGFEDGDDPVIWKAVNDVAAMVKDLDPNHPTMSVTAFVHGGRIEFLHKRSPAIDIHGVNAYGGAVVVPEQLRAGGATKPFVLTEFGPVGPWEMPKTEWGAPYEQTSTDKAAFYQRAYQEGIASAPGLALGSYAFLWGHKMEGTGTWFGMFLEDGSRTSAVDVMTEIWSGSPPENLAPSVERLDIEGSAQVDPGNEVSVSTAVADPEGDDVRVRWVLRPESGEYATGGDFRPNLPDIDGVVVESRDDGATVRMPEEPGPYRLFLYAYDEAGNAATANVPLLVKGTPRTRMPVSVYEDSFENMPWAPSGWMGGIDDLTLDGDYTEAPREGAASIRMRYEGKFNWVGVAWQNPPNNWGDLEGGFDLTGANELELWARGEYGGEKVSFGVGLLAKDRAHPDSGITKIDSIELTREWQRYSIPLKKLDLSSIKTGFVVTLTGRNTPVTIYLDSIRFIR
ncbi:MAG: hypothetical protein OEU90_09080 [Gammaproteobacteria bacterium]|nr:hypothetical protein [Gammaproteobacteria bacterium]MDH3750459.1 hypothetical protein [Gammaproteobacteria bacterium]MDH3805608.1 hypothetical protein [Gammaproteobacteria bacterium]